MKSLYDLLYGDKISQSQLKLFAILRRKIHRQYKESIKKFMYNQIWHVV